MCVCGSPSNIYWFLLACMQVLSRKLFLPAVKAGSTSPPKIVAVDLQPMAPVEGITQIQGDITSEATALQASTNCS